MATKLSDEDDLLEDEPAQAEEPDEAAEQEEAAAAPPIEEVVEDLKRQIENERRARLDAERKAAAAEQQAASSAAEVDDTNLHLVESAIDTVNQRLNVLKNEYAEALRLGDTRAAADINDDIIDRRSELTQLERGREQMKEAKLRQPVTPQPRSGTVAAEDMVEQLASNVSKKSGDWIRAHPEYATNPALYRRMAAAHTFVIESGVAPDTDEYFDQVETLLKIKKPPAAEPEDMGGAKRDAAPARRQASPPAAPVGGGGSDRPGAVRLSAAERETARDLDMTEKQYAEYKAKAIEQGRMK